MNHKQLYPIIATILLFLCAFAFFYPTLVGKKVLVQSDTMQYMGMSSEIREIAKEQNGRTIHWTNSMFGGMPTYLMNNRLFHSNNIVAQVNRSIRKTLGSPIGLVFIGLMCFYIFMQALQVNHWLSLIGSFAFMAGSFVIISIIAGHNTKINAYAYAPLILAGLIYIFRKKYWLGVFCLSFGLAAQIGVNHLQITFYTFLICLLFVFSESIRLLKSKSFKPLLTAGLFAFIGVVTALGISYNQLATTYIHSQYTTRGGQSEIQFNESNTNSNTGLDFDYATDWSYKPIESMTLLIPNFMGGASTEYLGEKSHWNKENINQIPKQTRDNPPTYWGQMPFTSAPVYIGIVIFAMVCFGFYVLPNRWKWWFLVSSMLMILLSWGKFSPVYDLFFNYFPQFNKFRTPMMSLLMLGLLLPMFGTMAVNHLIKTPNHAKQVKQSTGILIGLVILFGFVAPMLGFYSFSGIVDSNYGIQGNLLDLLQKDRKMLLRNDSIRSLFILLLTGLAFYLYSKKQIKLPLFLGALAILVFGDLFVINKRYLSNENYTSTAAYEKRFRATPIDKAIQQDKTPHYRVANLSGNLFNEANTSYHHQSVGGYHAAKLQVIQDIIDYTNPAQNREILNVLNARYFIGNTEEGQQVHQQNESAYGNAWFISQLIHTPSAKETVSLMTESPLDSVAFSTTLPTKPYSKLLNASISLTSYDPEKLTYTVQNNSNEDQFAVFSEVYYTQSDGDGWYATIDGKDTPIHKVNHFLRGLEVPAGNHEIVFEYKTTQFKKRQVISTVFNIVLLLLGILALLPLFTKSKQGDA